MPMIRPSKRIHLCLVSYVLRSNSAANMLVLACINSSGSVFVRDSASM